MKMKTDKPPSGLIWTLIILAVVMVVGMIAFALGWVPEYFKDEPKEDLQGRPVLEAPYRAPTKSDGP
jgi:flagellar basal body-associated protein FliL